ncbi:hypothetical protein N0V88_003831 [Collariella sp. IMI 366227]|nr:hypothetical protein N0V88_003831 [Collariella sp. IMI 366227]
MTINTTNPATSRSRPSPTAAATIPTLGRRRHRRRPLPPRVRNTHWYSYLLTADFWAIIAVGQLLSLCITATNTFTSFLSSAGTIIPAFQTLFNYALLTLVWLPITWYRMGFRDLFYSMAPLVLRMGSAAVFDVNLLTANFWGVIIGTRVFGYVVHWMYPIAFVLIICGLVVYFLAGSILGDSKKPWLGDNQKDGVAGIGTAKLKALNEASVASLGDVNLNGKTT